jgi:hypothetical protein
VRHRVRRNRPPVLHTRIPARPADRSGARDRQPRMSHTRQTRGLLPEWATSARYQPITHRQSRTAWAGERAPLDQRQESADLTDRFCGSGWSGPGRPPRPGWTASRIWPLGRASSATWPGGSRRSSTTPTRCSAGGMSSSPQPAARVRRAFPRRPLRLGPASDRGRCTGAGSGRAVAQAVHQQIEDAAGLVALGGFTGGEGHAAQAREHVGRLNARSCTQDILDGWSSVDLVS